MTNASNQYIVNTERGLALRGTRITLYDVMDYLKADYPHKYIRDIFNLTDEQMNGVLASSFSPSSPNPFSHQGRRGTIT